MARVRSQLRRYNSLGDVNAGSSRSVVRTGRLSYHTEERCLYADGEPVRLTPMQHRLLAMFFAAEGHSLSHREICDALWPKKPDASDTLYTLIRRLRCVVEQRSSLRIESDRGRAYRLTDR